MATILIVEDEEDIRAVYSEVLRDAGYSVIEAADGISASTQALGSSWDVMLLDIMLPGKDGMQVLTETRSEPKNAKKPIILLTNLGNENVITRCFDLGADGYLIKSEITPDKIVEEVKSFLEKQ